MKIVTPSEMKLMDKHAIDSGIPSIELMENAGIEVTKTIIENIKISHEKKIAVLSGIGNNGGDGLVVARHLFNAGYQVEIVIVGSLDKISQDTKYNMSILKEMGLYINIYGNNFSIKELDCLLARNDIIIDSILGIGLNKNISGSLYTIIETINNIKSYVISIDIPTGINGKNGTICGIAIKADHTIIIQNYKTGNMFNDALDYQGTVHVVDIGIDENIINNNKVLLLEEDIKGLINNRKKNSHKYHYGILLVLGGSKGMTGAPLMTGLSAYRTGAGLVTLGLTNRVENYVNNIYPELMVTSYDSVEELENLIYKKNVVVFGPGLGKHHDDYTHILEYLLDKDIPIVIDADGIYYLKKIAKKKILRKDIIITPHYGEMALFCGVETKDITKNPIYYCQKVAEELGFIVVLKGPNTIICDSQNIFINILGNPGMATAGSGDVLTGIIAALRGQGLEGIDAAKLGVYLHSFSGDIAAEEFGEYSLMATDIISKISSSIKELNIY